MTEELTVQWTPTQDEFDSFACLSGDDNPIHVDPEFSARTRFGRTVSHGMLIYAKLWMMIRELRPGVRQVGQTLMFPNPCFVGDDIRLSVTATGPAQFEVRAIRHSDSAVCLSGETRVQS